MDRKQTVRKKKPAENNEYFLMKDKKQRQKLTYFLVRAVTFRATIIFFVLFDLLFSYWYSYKAGWILSSILLCINSIFMAVEILILKKKIPKIRKLFQRIKMFYLDVVCMFLTFSLFLILIFSIINQPREWKDKPPIKCETYASSCARLGFNNQYRTNQIQNTYPLTFRNVTDLDIEIDKYLNDKYSGWIVKYDTNMNITHNDNWRYSVYSISNSFGIMNDVAIKIDSCQDVWSTTSVTIQSQLRLGLKDYGSNYDIIEGIIKFLSSMVSVTQQNYLYCKGKHD